MLTAESPEIIEFLKAWHENGRASFERTYQNLDYDSPSYAKTAKTRKRFIACDRGTGGEFLVDRTTGDVWSIKAYGVPNRKLGKLSTITEAYRNAKREMPVSGYVGNDAYIRQSAESRMQ